MNMSKAIVLFTIVDENVDFRYALKYFEINKVPPFEVFIHHEESYNVAPKKRRLLGYKYKITDQQIVLCCFTLLKKLPNELANKWDWTKFVNNFSGHESVDIRW